MGPFRFQTDQATMFENLSARFKIIVRIKQSTRNKTILAKIKKMKNTIRVSTFIFHFLTSTVIISNILRPYELEKAMSILARLMKVNDYIESRRNRKTLVIKNISMDGQLTSSFDLEKLFKRLQATGHETFLDPQRFPSLIVKYFPGYIYVSRQGNLKANEFVSITKLRNCLQNLERQSLTLH